MNKNGRVWVIAFMVLGILAIISGMYMIFREDYIGGIAGTVVGAFIVYLNVNQLKD